MCSCKPCRDLKSYGDLLGVASKNVSKSRRTTVERTAGRRTTDDGKIPSPNVEEPLFDYNVLQLQAFQFAASLRNFRCMITHRQSRLMLPDTFPG